ncbi:MAG: TrbI/VirB10 family protein [Succinivibrio sp.]
MKKQIKNQFMSKRLPKYPMMVALAFFCVFTIVLYAMTVSKMGSNEKSSFSETRKKESLEGNLAFAKKIRAGSDRAVIGSTQHKLSKQDASVLVNKKEKNSLQLGSGISVLDEENFYKGYIQYQDRNNFIDRTSERKSGYEADADVGFVSAQNNMSKERVKKGAGHERKSTQESVNPDLEAIGKARQDLFLQAIKAPSKVSLSAVSQGSASSDTRSQAKGYDRSYRDLSLDDRQNAGDDSYKSQGFKTLDSYAVLDQKSYISDSEVIYPKSPYALMQGSVIQAVLITGINSELPGQITAQVTRDIRDSIQARHLLIPKGSKLIGQYGSSASFGASRVFAGFNRIIFPDGSSVALGAMPGQSTDGYAGFDASVDNHYMKTIFNCVLLSAITSSAQSMESKYQNANGSDITVSRTARELSSNLSEALSNIIEKNINLSPTLTIAPGYVFSVALTKDLFFKSPYGLSEHEYYID